MSFGPMGFVPTIELIRFRHIPGTRDEGIEREREIERALRIKEMVLTNFDGVGIGFGFGVGCGFGIGWGFGGMPINVLGLGVGGGCGVGLALGWGFGTGYGSHYRSSRVVFQGVEFSRNNDGEGKDSILSKNSPKEISS